MLREVPQIGAWSIVPYPGDAPPWRADALLHRIAAAVDDESDPQLRVLRAFELIAQAARMHVYPPTALMDWLGAGLWAYIADDGGPNLERHFGVEGARGNRNPAAEYKHAATLGNRMYRVAWLVALGARDGDACAAVAEWVEALIAAGGPGKAPTADTLLQHWQRRYKRRLIGGQAREHAAARLDDVRREFGSVAALLASFPDTVTLTRIRGSMLETPPDLL